MRHPSTLLHLMAASIAASAAAGCASGEGTIAVALSTDAARAPAADGAEHIYVTVDQVRIATGGVGAAEPGAEPGADEADDGGGWVTVFDGAATLDLADPAATAAFLGKAIVPSGSIDQIRLVIAPDPTLTVGGVVSPMACPSCTETGIKVVPHGTLVVPDGGTLSVTLTFDPRASVRRDDTGWMLAPVVRL